MIRWTANVLSCVSHWKFDGMPFEIHFGCRGGLGPHVGGPWRCQGLGLGPGLARGPHNGLDCTPARAGAWFYQEPGIQNLCQVEGDLAALGPTINQTTA